MAQWLNVLQIYIQPTLSNSPGDRKNVRITKVRIAEIRLIKAFVRRLSRDLKILFELANVRITRVRIRQS